MKTQITLMVCRHFSCRISSLQAPRLALTIHSTAAFSMLRLVSDQTLPGCLLLPRPNCRALLLGQPSPAFALKPINCDSSLVILYSPELCFRCSRSEYSFPLENSITRFLYLGVLHFS